MKVLLMHSLAFCECKYLEIPFSKGNRNRNFIMGRQGNDQNPTAVKTTTSIALLQERFRKLERVREKREEKELLKQFSESSVRRMTPPRPIGFEFGSQSRSAEPDEDSLSLGLNLQTKHVVSTRPSKLSPEYWPNGNSFSAAGSSRSYENSDVDTSLHL
ncbi:hypothetical protein ACFE04_017352 [Oxalis oulophora]